MAHIKVIDYEESEGRLRAIYDELIGKRGKLADVHKVQSLRPESIVKHMDLYLEIMFSKSELSRAEREMIAVVVSAGNNCEYCQIHHGAALNHYWKDENKCFQLRKDFKEAGLNERQLALCNYGYTLTVEPGKANSEDLTIALKKMGFADAAILDATLVVSYFNFVNRIVLSLGLDAHADDSRGYNY